MSRDQTEHFKTDNDGDVSREPDEYKSQAGADERNGLTTLAGNGLDSPELVYTTPDDARGVVVSQVAAYNGTGAAADFQVFAVALDDNDNITDSWQITTQQPVADGTREVVERVGEPVEDGGVAVGSGAALEVSVGGRLDYREPEEPEVEFTG